MPSGASTPANQGRTRDERRGTWTSEPQDAMISPQEGTRAESAEFLLALVPQRFPPIETSAVKRKRALMLMWVRIVRESDTRR
jgi:hypothetical protein